MQQDPIRPELAPLVVNFLAGDLEELAEKLTDRTLLYVFSDAMRVRIETLRAEIYSIASSLRGGDGKAHDGDL